MQELVAFAKTKELAAGETQTLTFNFTDYELAWYDVARSAWVAEAGNYNILLAARSRFFRLLSLFERISHYNTPLSLNSDTTARNASQESLFGAVKLIGR